MSESPKIIFFDLDETLIENMRPIQNLFASIFEPFSERLGNENESIFYKSFGQSAQSLWTTMFDSSESPEAQFLECFHKAILATNSVNLTTARILSSEMYDAYLQLSVDNVCFQSNALTTLNTLSDQGYMTGIITNGIEQLQLAKINHLELEKQVDAVIVSAQARAHKPSKTVFEYALKQVNATAEQAWQIGDHPLNDVAGSIRTGMTGVFYDPKIDTKRSNQQDIVDQAFSDISESPSHVIRDLAEIIELV